MTCSGCPATDRTVLVSSPYGRWCRRCWLDTTAPVLNKQGKVITWFPPTPKLDAAIEAATKAAK